MKTAFLASIILAVFLVANFVSAQETTAPAKPPLPDEGNPQFEPLWENYLNAFLPLKDAFMSGDFTTAREYLPHLQDTAGQLRQARFPNYESDEARKAIKTVLKATKEFLKMSRSGERAKIQESFDHLKTAVDKFESLRTRHR